MKLTTFLICLMATPLLFAGDGEKRERGGKGHGIFKQLDLSEDQRKELKEIRQSRKDKMKSLREAKKSSRENFQNSLKSGASASSLKSLHKKMLSSHNEFKTYRFETMLKTRELLNSSQKSKFHELKEQMKGRRGDRD